MNTKTYLLHHNKIVRHDGSVYRIIAQSLGLRVLVDAECLVGSNKGSCVNLLSSRTPLAKTLRTHIGMNLVS